MLIHLRNRYTILGEVYFGPDASDLRFSVPLESFNPVIVEIIPSGNEVEASHTVEVSEKMSNFLQTSTSFDLKKRQDFLSAVFLISMPKRLIKIQELDPIFIPSQLKAEILR